MKLKAIGCLAALLLVVGKTEANEKPAPCSVYFSVLENDAVPSPVRISKMNKPQSSWYAKHGDRDKYAGICYTENPPGVPKDTPLYAMVWGQHSASEPYDFNYDAPPEAKADGDSSKADQAGGKKQYVSDGWLAIWDPKANGGKGSFVSVAPLDIQNHADLNAASTSLLIAAMEQISQKESEKLAAAASERGSHSKNAKGGKEGNAKNGWTEITITPIDNGPVVTAEGASSPPRSDVDHAQPVIPPTTATAPEYSPAQSPASGSTVSVGSTPVGADIYVDDDFVGNTPSTINVATGRHVITLKKAGFQNWARVVNFSGGLVTLNADMVAESGPSEIPAAAPATTAESATDPPTGAATDKPPATISKIPGWIGVSAKNGLAGALVTTVSAQGPAARAGIHVGDVILALDGQLIKGKDFAAEVAALKPGTRIPVDYTRGAAAHEAWITVGSQN